MGKTGLILRLFDEISQKKQSYGTIYLDIYATRTLDDFINALAEAVLVHYPEKTKVGKQFLNWIRSVRPIFSYDAISGMPQITFTHQRPEEKENTLYGLLDFLNRQEEMVIAIDEFQQIADYPEKNVEALLRTYIQQFPRLHFIFCGSKKAMMIDLFSNAKRPFYASTQYVSLEEIDDAVYADFIREKFQTNGFSIDEEAITFILDWSMRHTFFTQSLCNKTFSLQKKKVDLAVVKQACCVLLEQQEPVFLQYRQLLTPVQWNFLIAVAKEGFVTKITSAQFIAKHNIGTPANARRINNSLIAKELILEITQKESTTYRIYDVFLSRWLDSKY